MQAIAEQVRVVRRGLRLSGKHSDTAWLVERAADLLSKYQVRRCAQAEPFSGHLLALYVLVPCAALELIADGTVMVLNMSVVYRGNGIPRRATSMKVRWVAEEEIQSGQTVMTEDGHRMYSLRRKKDNFLVHAITEGCPGCQAIIAGTTAWSHSEACRSRMESAVDKTDDGRQRREKAGAQRE